MNNIKEIMLNKENWAVVGVVEDEERFSYKIWKILQEFGYKTYGINPNINEIEGQKIYSSVKDIEDKIDVLDMVVRPEIALKTLKEAKEAGIEYIFFQPGSYNNQVIERVKELELKYLDGDCIYATLLKKK